jgi:hypothetical protein
MSRDAVTKDIKTTNHHHLALQKQQLHKNLTACLIGGVGGRDWQFMGMRIKSH